MVGGGGLMEFRPKIALLSVLQRFARVQRRFTAFYIVSQRFAALYCALQRFAALYQEDMDCVCVRGDAMSMSE